MKHAILDTSFILTCIRNKIDFFEDLNFKGIKIIIPLQVIKEIHGIAKSKKKFRFREEAKLVIKILASNKFKKVDLKSKNVDNGIIKFANSEKNCVLATLDKEIKKKAKCPKIIIRQKKKLEFA